MIIQICDSHFVVLMISNQSLFLAAYRADDFKEKFQLIFFKESYSIYNPLVFV